MSNIQRYENLNQIVVKTETDFNELAKIHGAVNFKREAGFAMQILSENNYLSEQAANAPDSLRYAVLNVAAIGLTLSPVLKLAYLVPRKGKVCLDISYQGLKQLGVECGAVVLVKSALVYAEDNFVLRGFDKEPIHEHKPFDGKKRGEILGGYNTAKTPAGDWITVTMDIEEIHKIRGRSESYSSGKASPWKTDFEEMAKKTLTKRGYKDWPKSGTPEQKERLAQAMEADKEDYVETTSTPVDNEKPNENIAVAKTLLAELNRSEVQFLEHISKVAKREIKTFEDLTPIELTQAIAQLTQWTKSEKKKSEQSAASPSKTTPETDNADSLKADKPVEKEVNKEVVKKKKDQPIDFLVQRSGEMICDHWKDHKGTMIKNIPKDELLDHLSVMDTESLNFQFSNKEVEFYNSACTFLGRDRKLKV